jgi:hypothetical protein
METASGLKTKPGLKMYQKGCLRNSFVKNSKRDKSSFLKFKKIAQNTRLVIIVSARKDRKAVMPVLK